MRILLTFDTDYAPHAATVMESIIQNCPEKLDFVAIYYDLDKETQDIFSKHFEPKVNSLEFVRLDEVVLKSTIKDVKTIEHLKNLNVYLRIFSSKLLPNDEYVIYLDCDIIVQENILKILDMADLSKPVCAVTEYDHAYKRRNLTKLKSIERPYTNSWHEEAYWYRTYLDLGMSQTAKYFNTGVLIINLTYWRQYKIAETALAFLLEYPEKALAADQDALNHAINGNYYVLAPRWNSVAVFCAVFSNYPAEQLEETVIRPAIIHVVGPQKPWHYGCNSKWQKLYWKYRRSTPWADEKYKDKTKA